jgi:sulfoxide reductase heme-binding subunit YedZ
LASPPSSPRGDRVPVPDRPPGRQPHRHGHEPAGLWTLILLLCSLACTPLKLVLGLELAAAGAQAARPLRLQPTSACTSCVYLVLDQFFAWDEIWKDIAKRKFITVGFAAFVLLIPWRSPRPRGW